MFRMATNVCLNKIRTRKRRPETPDQTLLEELAALDDNEARAGAAQLLSKIFGREKPSTATIAVMHLVDGMTHEEVAKEVGLSVSGVRKRLRGLRATALAVEGEQS